MIVEYDVHSHISGENSHASIYISHYERFESDGWEIRCTYSCGGMCVPMNFATRHAMNETKSIPPFEFLMRIKAEIEKFRCEQCIEDFSFLLTEKKPLVVLFAAWGT